MDFFEMIVSQYGSVHHCCKALGIDYDQFKRQMRSGDTRFLDAIADHCKLSRQEVRWEFHYYKENT